jgi:hypothetical protein
MPLESDLDAFRRHKEDYDYLCEEYIQAKKQNNQILMEKYNNEALRSRGVLGDIAIKICNKLIEIK